MAVGVGFEPTAHRRWTTVFKTAAFVRSATPPCSFMAEREGFEPSVPVRGQHLSRVPRSTAPAPLLTFKKLLKKSFSTFSKVNRIFLKFNSEQSSIAIKFKKDKFILYFLPFTNSLVLV